MRRGAFCSSSTLLLGLLLVVAFCCHVGANKKSPNLILIVTDDHGYNDVGFNGCTDIPTPHLDSIAKNGIRFTDGYVSAPICGPSRAGLLTGRYQDRFGFVNNPSTDPNNPNIGIPHEEKNIAEVLKQVGYRSSVIGKWHMGSHPVHHPLNRGFDHFFGFLAGGHAYFPDQFTLNDLNEVKQKSEWYYTRILNGTEPTDIDRYLTDSLTDAANTFIDESVKTSDSPFFLYLAYNAPHGPMQASEEYLSRFAHIADEKRRTYAAMVSAVDDGVGRLLENIRRHGIEEDTLLVFLSDNGGKLGQGADNSPLRGHKTDLFEGGMRVPFAMQWKGTLPPGVNYTQPIISLDIMATIVELAGASIAPERPLDGVNLMPFLTVGVMNESSQQEQAPPPHEELFWRMWRHNGMAIRQGDMKLVINKNREKENYNLFNLATNIGEENKFKHIINASDITQALKQTWDRWNGQLMGKVFPSLSEDEWWLNNGASGPTTDNPDKSTGPTTSPTDNPTTSTEILTGWPPRPRSSHRL